MATLNIRRMEKAPLMYDIVRTVYIKWDMKQLLGSQISATKLEVVTGQNPHH